MKPKSINLTRRTAIASGVSALTLCSQIPLLGQVLNIIEKKDRDSLEHNPDVGIYKNQDNVNLFDHKPSFISWSVGGKPFADIMSAQSGDFQYRFEPRIDAGQTFSFRQEVARALEIVDRQRNGQEIALAVSGGQDSEVLAFMMQRMGIPFEMFFLDVWGINNHFLQTWIKPFSRRHNVPLHIVSLERKFFLEDYLKKAFYEVGTEMPTYLGLTYLFSQVPKDYFLLVGEGDLDKKSAGYEHLFKDQEGRSPRDLGGKRLLPFSTTEIAYRVWAQKHKRRGQFYFYSSTPELVASVMHHPLFQVYSPYANTKQMMAFEFPEVLHRPKSTNWESAWHENTAVREVIYQIAKEDSQLRFWNPKINCVSDITSIIRKKGIG